MSVPRASTPSYHLAEILCKSQLKGHPTLNSSGIPVTCFFTPPLAFHGVHLPCAPTHTRPLPLDCPFSRAGLPLGSSLPPPEKYALRCPNISLSSSPKQGLCAEHVGDLQGFPPDHGTVTSRCTRSERPGLSSFTVLHTKGLRFLVSVCLLLSEHKPRAGHASAHCVHLGALSHRGTRQVHGRHSVYRCRMDQLIWQEEQERSQNKIVLVCLVFAPSIPERRELKPPKMLQCPSISGIPQIHQQQMLCKPWVLA